MTEAAVTATAKAASEADSAAPALLWHRLQLRSSRSRSHAQLANRFSRSDSTLGSKRFLGITPERKRIISPSTHALGCPCCQPVVSRVVCRQH